MTQSGHWPEGLSPPRSLEYEKSDDDEGSHAEQGDAKNFRALTRLLASFHNLLQHDAASALQSASQWKYL